MSRLSSVVDTCVTMQAKAGNPLIHNNFQEEPVSFWATAPNRQETESGYAVAEELAVELVAIGVLRLVFQNMVMDYTFQPTPVHLAVGLPTSRIRLCRNTWGGYRKAGGHSCD